MRQRVKARNSPLRFIGRIVLILVSLILVWYGLMLFLLALKTSPDTINSISAYRDIYEDLIAIGPEDVTDDVRLITAFAGLVSFLFFGWLALKEIPKPYFTRSHLTMAPDERGSLEVGARAIERVAETAAVQNSGVSAASGRYANDDLLVNVAVKRARDTPEILRDVQRRVSEALVQHELPPLPVSVTLTGFDRQQRRELH